MKWANSKPSDDKIWGCGWIGFNVAFEGPGHSNFLHLIDWKLGGVLSRFLISMQKGPVFVPTMGRLNFGLLCLDRAPLRPLNYLLDQAEKCHWEKVLFVTEEDSIRSSVKEDVEKIKPLKVDLYIADAD